MGYSSNHFNPLALAVSLALAAVPSSWAGDILRGGASGTPQTNAPTATSGTTTAQAARALANASDSLARTTAALQSVQAMQAAARKVAIAGPNNLGRNPNFPNQILPNVPNGLVIGGLQVAPGVPINLAAPTAGENVSLWKGAKLPTQTVSGGKTKVTIVQTQSQALLNWKTFNIGKQTQLTFDQTAGKADAGKWIAFNKINDPSGNPTQILGSLDAIGQVYVINQNGIIFGGSSQINTRTFVASALPINDNLISRGLLNNPNAEFLFSGLKTVIDPTFVVSETSPGRTLAEPLLLNRDKSLVQTPKLSFANSSGGQTRLEINADYILSTNPTTGATQVTFTAQGLAAISTNPVTASYVSATEKSGNITVQPGARISGPVNADGNGGRVMLVAANVLNAGQISTPSGQTILAAGLQLGVAAHNSNDPSLRGLDTWVGAVADYSGDAFNTGLIETLTGSTTITGRTVGQLGVINSSTSVSLNGRIDLRASYGAVSNLTFNSSTGAVAPPFLYQKSGLVKLGMESASVILPDYASIKTVPGMTLPENSQINVQGLAVHFDKKSLLFAPSADVSIQAGSWPYQDLDQNNNTNQADGVTRETDLDTNFTGTTQRFLFSTGQIFVDQGATLNVAGTPDVFVPLSQSILNLEFRGAELADSPVQRDGPLRAVPLTVDIRRTGNNNGYYWMGTPLGDVTGVAGLIQRNVGQLTARGGSLSLRAGESIVLQSSSTLDVSGGYFQHESGNVRTSRLLQDGHLVDIFRASPSENFEGIYTGTFTMTFAKYGLSETFTNPLALTGEHFEAGYVQGADGGSLSITAPSMAIDGTLLGKTVQGPIDYSLPPGQSSLSFEFAGETKLTVPNLPPSFIITSPTPPKITFSNNNFLPAVESFQWLGENPAPLSSSRLENVFFSPDLLTEQGFGKLNIENAEGDIILPQGTDLSAPVLGSIRLAGSNIEISGDVFAPSGSLQFVAYNLSPTFIARARVELPQPGPALTAREDRGLFTLSSGSRLDTAGSVFDEVQGSLTDLVRPLLTDGGRISIDAYSAALERSSVINVSGGVSVSSRNTYSYGKGGSITINTGKNPEGGSLTLQSTLMGFSGRQGGSVNIQASLIRIGGSAVYPNTLLLQPDFFRQGGFTSYRLTGIGAAIGEFSEGTPLLYAPAISLAEGTRIKPLAENWLATSTGLGAGRVVLSPTVRPQGLQSPVSISLIATGFNDSFTQDFLEARGDIVLEKGSSIVTNPGSTISLKGDTISVQGSLFAPGGNISLEGRNEFVGDSESDGVLATIYLGKGAILSTAGTPVYLPDQFGRRVGTLLPGGDISIAGNIVAESSATLDVSGSSAVFDMHPSVTSEITQPIVPANSGVTAPLWRLSSTSVSQDSDAGSITFLGGQMLYSDALLLGNAGGPTARGGTLTVESGSLLPLTTADINLVVVQSGKLILFNNIRLGIGMPVLNAENDSLPGVGNFVADQFRRGGFSSLALNGNVEFRGPVTILASGSLQVASNGVFKADDQVNLSGSYVKLGRAFLPPVHPDDIVDPIFRFVTSNLEYRLAPVFGSGRLTVRGDLIDVGTLTLQDIGRATFIAKDGDIRGNGTLNIAGDLILKAAQIYPTTLTTFNLFAYDHDQEKGSITFAPSGSQPAPWSIGGTLNVFASKIIQGGILRAPLGSINLGWDGKDFLPSTLAFDQPLNPLFPLPGTGLANTPISQLLILRPGSETSVSMATVGNGKLPIPFGLSPDGSSWIDPRGVNVTVNGLTEKQILLRGETIFTQGNSSLNISGGGELYAYRWISGAGGNVDLLGTASSDWSAATVYQPGNLVTYNGKTFSTRVRNSGQTPSVSLFWTEVAESFAIVPGYNGSFAPYAPFNTGANATLLGGDAGYTDNNIALGDQIYLEASTGRKAGTYTLLPRRYALLPGAFLVTPGTGEPIGTFNLPLGSDYVSGYRSNQFNQPELLPELRSRFEVSSFDVTRKRASYNDYLGNAFFTKAAERLEVASPQRLPIDSGYLLFQGNSGLRLQGNVLSSHPETGRGSRVDISSSADIYLVDHLGKAPAGSTVVLDISRLNSWGTESLLIGGSRRPGANGTIVKVTTGNLVLDNRGSSLTGPEISLVSGGSLTLMAGASVISTGLLTEPAETFRITGDGTLLRVSSDASADTIRTAITNATTSLLTIGDGTLISGPSVTLDSTYGTRLSEKANIVSQSLTLGSGQISILLNPVSVLTGELVVPHLTISGQFLSKVQQVSDLTLRSYSTIDFYGAGTFGNSNLKTIEFLASGLRGFEQGVGSVNLRARNILFENSAEIDQLTASGSASGRLNVLSDSIRLGDNTFSIKGFETLTLTAIKAVIGDGKGTFITPANLTINTPVFIGTQGSTVAIEAGGELSLNSISGQSAQTTSGLGASLSFTGASVFANTSFLLPSGQLSFEAATGNLTVGGNLDVSGTMQRFYDIVRYSDAGRITLTAELGDVEFLTGSRVSVASPAGGGNAGTIAVSAVEGSLNLADANFQGQAAGAKQTSGSFLLDVKVLPSYIALAETLNLGGFVEARDLRVRTGDVVIANVLGRTNMARNFSVTTDQGNILVTGTIDASGITGGKISLMANGSLTLANGSLLTAHADTFSNAGKGGEIRLEAGASSNGVENLLGILDIQAGSTIDLGVENYVPGNVTTARSSAFYGQLTGTLHLRAPRNGNDVNVSSLAGNILNASSVIVEGYRIYDRTATGTLDTTLRSAINNDAKNYFTAGYDSMHTKLLAGAPDATGLDSVLVIAPGVEIINLAGDLELGTTTTINTSDWDLSSFRYGPKLAPGILTLRATGDIVFNNALSDGFTPVTASAANGHSALWLARVTAINANLPLNTQSWSYRLTSGSDLASANFRSVLDSEDLLPDKGSILVGQFYPAIPNLNDFGSGAAVGSDGLTANNIRISTSDTNTGTRYEVVRSGTGSIDINAGFDVQLRNTFATIYTAGVALSNPQTIFASNDFLSPSVVLTSLRHPDQGGESGLGAIQQSYAPQWTLAGGNVTISAHADIERVTLVDGLLVSDTSRQMPTNWLYRRGAIDNSTGTFGAANLFAGQGSTKNFNDPSASTTWWIDFSNFFQGIGALGGGDVTLLASSDIINIDAVVPTNARMPGRKVVDPAASPLTFTNIAPDSNNLVELGGGNLTVRSGANIDGGIYYVEKGQGKLFADGSITTNQSRSPSLGLLASSGGTAPYLDSKTWLPTTLFVGKSQFAITARGDVLLGPTLNPFLLPQGLNNKYWYKTYFNTFSEDAAVSVVSYGGNITHRLGTTSVLQQWFSTQNQFGSETASYYQPWLRLSEASVTNFDTAFTIAPPTLQSTAFTGDVNIVGRLNLSPSSRGNLEIAAAGDVIGLQPVDTIITPTGPRTFWTSAQINLSDTNPFTLPRIEAPLAYQSVAGILAGNLRSNLSDPFTGLNLQFDETGSFTGLDGSVEVKQALHAPQPIHLNDSNPLRLYAKGGDISGLILYSSKKSQVFALNNISDVSFYIQNVNVNDISIVSAGRDIIPYNENAPLRSLANNLSAGNSVTGPNFTTVQGDLVNALPGDIQISGPGVLEVLAGRDLDLGTGANLIEGNGVGTGAGLTSIGNFRNPVLASQGANIIAFAGVTGASGTGPAVGLTQSSLDFPTFVADSTIDIETFDSPYMTQLGVEDYNVLNSEQQAIVTLEVFFLTLRDAGRAFATTGVYTPGFNAITSLFGTSQYNGEILTRARDIRTSSGGTITIAAPGGGLTLASDITGNPLTPPGIVTEFGGAISILTNENVDIGLARIFTLRGGDIIIWSAAGNIAAGNAPKTVVTAPPTRVTIDVSSADLQTDLGGLATGGGIGVLASVEGVLPGDVDLIAPTGFVDAGDAGIRTTGNLNIAAVFVLNADNIQAAGSSTGVPVSVVSLPNLSGLTAASNSATSSTAAASDIAKQNQNQGQQEELPSVIIVEVLGYGG